MRCCRQARMRRAEVVSAAAEDAVGDAGADDVGVEQAREPGGPLLVLEVDRADGDSLGELDIHAAAVSDVGEFPGGVVVLEVHFGDADQDLGIGRGLPELVQRDARPDEVVVFVNILELVEAQPAAFTLDLEPAGELHVYESADAGQLVGAVVGLKDRPLAAGDDGELPRKGRGRNLRAGWPDSTSRHRRGGPAPRMEVDSESAQPESAWRASRLRSSWVDEAL